MSDSRSTTFPVVRAYREGDEMGIDVLLKTCFPRYKGFGYWKWIHKNNPIGFNGDKGDIWVADAIGKIVGYYGRIRYKVKFFGRYAFACQGTQIATHPDFRRQGIALKIFSSVYAPNIFKQIGFAFGYPNHASYLVYKKFTSANRNNYGFIDMGSPEAFLILDKKKYLQANYVKFRSRLERSVALIPTHKIQRSSAAKSMRDITVSDEIEDDAGFVWSSIDRLIDVGIERSTEYLRWRYHDDWGKYQVVSVLKGTETRGYAVFRHRVKRGVSLISVCELLAHDDSEEIYDSLLQEILKEARLARAAYIELSPSCLPGYSASIKKNGFFVPGILHGRMRTTSSHLVVSSHNPELATSLKEARWYHSLGDKDYV